MSQAGENSRSEVAKMYRSGLLAGVVLLFGCTKPTTNSQPSDEAMDTIQVLGIPTPILTSRQDLSKYVGGLVNLRGTVSNSKVPRISGVQIKATDEQIKATDEHRGSLCHASGILIGIVSENNDAEIDIAQPKYPSGQMCFTLYSDLAGKLSESKLVAE